MTTIHTAARVAQTVLAAQGEKPTRVRAGGGFSFSRASAAERAVGPLFGVFLTYGVARIQEVFPVLEVAHLAQVIGILCLAVLATSIGVTGWVAMWRQSFTLRAMVGLFGLALITIFLGIWVAGSWYYFKEKYIIQWLLFLIGAILFRDRTIMRTSIAMVSAAVTAAAWMAVSGQANMGGDVDRVYIGGTGGTRGSLDPNDFGAILVSIIPLALWLGSTSGPFRKVLWYGAAMLMVGAIAPTASRGALIGLATVGLVLILIGTTGYKRIFMGGFVALAILLFTTVVNDAQMARFGAIGGDDDYNVSSGEGRIAIWKRGIVWTIKRPTGYGLDNFPIYFGWLNGKEKAAHNSFVQIAVELGVAGLILFVLIYWRGLKDGWRYLRELRKLGKGPRPPPLARETSLVGMAIASITGALVTGFFLSNAYASITMFVFAILAGMELGRTALPNGGPIPAGLPARRGYRSRS